MGRRNSGLGRSNRLRRGFSEVAGQPGFGEEPDYPLRGIPLPGFNSVAVVVLKFMMIIVITFSEGKDRHQE